MINNLTKNPIRCEIHAMIFLNAKNLTAAKIHRQTCNAYGPSVISEGKCGSELGNLKLAKQTCTMRIAVAAHPS
jgi:hypothetical protein